MDLTDLQITSRDNTIAYLTTRAEQAAKDAVEMAKALQYTLKLDIIELWTDDLDREDIIEQYVLTNPLFIQAQTIIDKYKETT